MTTATLTSKCRVTIPKSIRELLGLDTGDRLEFRLNDRGKVEIDPVRENPLIGSSASPFDASVARIEASDRRRPGIVAAASPPRRKNEVA